MVTISKTIHSNTSLWQWWRHQMESFSRYWPFMRGIQRSPTASFHKGQWRGALIFSLIYTWTNGWANNRGAGDLRHHCAHYDVAVMNTEILMQNMIISGTVHSIFLLYEYCCLGKRNLHCAFQMYVDMMQAKMIIRLHIEAAIPYEHDKLTHIRLCFYQTRSAGTIDQWSNKNHSPAYNFAPTVTKCCVVWEGLSLPHDTKFGNCMCEIVDSRAFPSWSLIHGFLLFSASTCVSEPLH